MPFAVTVFISAFLLFQVQPIIARFLLPWYGGGTGVWTTCILFFQVGLLAGYLYAFLLKRFVATRQQVISHLFILTITLLLLPITPSELLKPNGVDSPVIGILLLLLSTVGAPYVLISATGPLLQHWYSVRYQDKSPYRLYALSNFASLLGLVSYPFIVEPVLNLQTQTFVWSAGYVAFVLVCTWCGSMLIKHITVVEAEKVIKEETTKLEFIHPFLWLGFSACGSILLLATTNKITQDVAAVPFLWIIPLVLFLVTFIIAFDSPRWYRRYFWLPAFSLALVLTAKILKLDHGGNSSWTVMQMVASYCGTMFVACMVCHGEMTRIKPSPTHLTFFYLVIAFGGVIGGAFVSLIAPQIFNGYWEFHLAWLLVALLVVVTVVRNFDSSVSAIVKHGVLIACFVVVILLSKFLFDNINRHHVGALAERRNFYGVLRVYEEESGAGGKIRSLHHGAITHGKQFMSPENKTWPTTYYGLNSGGDLVIRRHPKRYSNSSSDVESKGLNIGVIGLGIGTLATYTIAEDKIIFYDINPEVENIAREYFTFLEDAKSSVEIVIGDARISLERELQINGSNKFDVLVLDAFSGDAIPVHLLTREAFELYWNHLNDNGLLAIHISNRYINLRPVVKALANYFDKRIFYVKTKDVESTAQAGSQWVILTSNVNFLSYRMRKGFSDMPKDDPENILWTDDYSSVLPLFKN